MPLILAAVCSVVIIGVVFFRTNTTREYNSQSIETAVPPNADIKIEESDPRTKWGESADLKFTYGYVVDKLDDVLLIQQILLTGEYGATLFRIDVDKNTNYEYVSSEDIKKGEERVRSQGRKGSFLEIKPKMYVFFATRDPLLTTPAIYAQTISYSEASPVPMKFENQ